MNSRPARDRHHQTFDINEVMLTKIERGHERLRRGMPVSEYIIECMLRKQLFLPIDTAFGKTPNYISKVSPYIVEQIDATSNGAHRPPLCRALHVGEPVASYIIRCTYL